MLTTVRNPCNAVQQRFVLYLMGVIAGALGSSVFDPDSNVVGASGAVYTVMGAWTAELIQNWDTMRYKWVQLLTTLTLTGTGGHTLLSILFLFLSPYRFEIRRLLDAPTPLPLPPPPSASLPFSLPLSLPRARARAVTLVYLC